ncbi:MAG: dephospho-CoA kinase [Chloroflexi bacterium]|nr:dephospho-CoA kinase [Chloroflexota bacterium]
MLVIGLTGGILSGKSTVSQMLSRLGAVVIDADKVGHEIYLPHTEVWQELVKAFGDRILKDNDEIDRDRLGEIVFNDPPALARLNAIVHPRMYRLIEQRLKDLERQGAQVMVLEAALLIEANWRPLVNQVWVTTAAEEAVLQRLGNRSRLSREQALGRIRAQLSNGERARHADVVIDTNCPLSQVEARVKELWDRIILGKG